MTSLLLLFFVVILVIYALSQLIEEPITEPESRAVRCPHCDARIRMGRRLCHACGERLG